MEPEVKDISVRKLKMHTYRALQSRAKKNGHSTEAEIRAILDAAVKPPKGEKGLGTALYEMAQDIRRKHGDFEIDFDSLRDKSPARFLKFE